MIYIDFDSDSFAPVNCCAPVKKNTTPSCDPCAWDRQDYPIDCEWIMVNDCPKDCSPCKNPEILCKNECF